MTHDDVTRKTRALRKYEGEPIAVRRDEGPSPFTLLSPFGPLIGRTLASDDLVRRVNAYADTIAVAERGSEFAVAPQFAANGGPASLLAFLTVQIRRYVAMAEGAEPRQVEIEIIWIISQYEGTPSPVHFHSGDVSGVLYLKSPAAPSEAELAKTYISGRHAGYLNFITGGKQRFAKTVFSVPPDVGTLYLFPGWLLHGAEPFRGPGERRSLSFNARIGELR